MDHLHPITRNFSSGCILLIIATILWKGVLALPKMATDRPVTGEEMGIFGVALLMILVAVACALFGLFFLGRAAVRLYVELRYWDDSKFERQVLTALSKVPLGYYQMYDGLACSGELIGRDWPFYMTRLDMMVRCGLIEQKTFSPSIFRSYQNVPGFRLSKAQMGMSEMRTL